MQLQVNFYSPTEFSVDIQYDEQYEPETEQEIDLFIFTCFTLRQFRNLGRNFISDALAGVLMKQDCVSLIMNNDDKLKDGLDLLRDVEIYRQRVGQMDFSLQMTAMIDILSQLVQDPKTNIVSRDILAFSPRLVPNAGDGKKRFIAKYPPFLFYAKGFGFFGKKVNYYAFHSTIGLIKYFASKYANNEEFIKRLENVSSSCARYYINNKIPMDQATLALQIIKNVTTTET